MFQTFFFFPFFCFCRFVMNGISSLSFFYKRYSIHKIINSQKENRTNKTLHGHIFFPSSSFNLSFSFFFHFIFFVVVVIIIIIIFFMFFFLFMFYIRMNYTERHWLRTQFLIECVFSSSSSSFSSYSACIFLFFVLFCLFLGLFLNVQLYNNIGRTSTPVGGEKERERKTERQKWNQASLLRANLFGKETKFASLLIFLLLLLLLLQFVLVI